MTLKVSAPNGVKVYNIAGGKSLPEWLSQKKKEALRKDETFRRRIELIQELECPTSSSRVKVSPDGNFLVVTGIHPPQVRRVESLQVG
jgi:ribosome biogenesis protein ENP2